MSEIDDFLLVEELQKKGYFDLAETVYSLLEERREVLKGLTDEVSSLKLNINEINEDIEHIMKGFPYNDTVAHRSYHDSIIEATEAEKVFWQNLKKDLATKGVWSLLVVLLGLLVTGISYKLGIAK